MSSDGAGERSQEAAEMLEQWHSCRHLVLRKVSDPFETDTPGYYCDACGRFMFELTEAGTRSQDSIDLEILQIQHEATKRYVAYLEAGQDMQELEAAYDSLTLLVNARRNEEDQLATLRRQLHGERLLRLLAEQEVRLIQQQVVEQQVQPAIDEARAALEGLE